MQTCRTTKPAIASYVLTLLSQRSGYRGKSPRSRDPAASLCFFATIAKLKPKAQACGQRQSSRASCKEGSNKQKEKANRREERVPHLRWSLVFRVSVAMLASLCLCWPICVCASLTVAALLSGCGCAVMWLHCRYAICQLLPLSVQSFGFSIPLISWAKTSPSRLSAPARPPIGQTCFFVV